MYCGKYRNSLWIHAEPKKSMLDCVLSNMKNFDVCSGDAHDKDDWKLRIKVATS